VSLVNVHNDAYGRDDAATCKYCGGNFVWKYSNYHKKDKPYELDGMRYHTCKNGGAKVTVIKMTTEEMNKMNSD
jgi:hypothetical protein